MIRLFISVLCAFGLAFSSVAAGSAIAAPAAMPGCTMDGRVPAAPADHSKMDCCTTACQISAAAALLPERSPVSTPLAIDRAVHGLDAAKELVSFNTSGVDPPPRLPS